jgi:hypothetical protein
VPTLRQFACHGQAIDRTGPDRKRCECGELIDVLTEDITAVTGLLQAGLWLLGGYGVLALAFGLFYSLFLPARLAPGARRSSIAFRLLLVPGAALLFPFLLLRLMFRPAAGR